jgi:hypothetical protein
MKEDIKNLLKERLCNSFAQALFKLVSTPYLTLKTILALFSLGSSGLTSYLVIQSLFAYLNYGVSLSSRTYHETTTLFPKVTFCNLNSLATKYAYNVNGANYYDNLIGANMQNDEKKKLGHDLNDILIDCEFNLKKCDSNNFTWSYDPWFGNCYTFNSGFDANGSKVDLEKSIIAGYKFGLQLTLYVNIYEKLYDLLTGGLGVIIRIGNSSFLSFSDTNGLFVPPGHNTYISVDREFKTILPQPYSNCEVAGSFWSNSFLYNFIARSEYAYSQQFCLTQCLQKKLIDKYNCSFAFFPSIFNISTCNFIFSIEDALSNFEDNFINKVCLPICPLECSHNLYKTFISAHQLNGNFYLFKIQNNSQLASDFISRKIDASTVENAISQINIYYDSLSYTLSTESSQMDIVSLFGSIGGNLSLFLGVTVLSLMEIIEVAIEICLN